MRQPGFLVLAVVSSVVVTALSEQTPAELCEEYCIKFDEACPDVDIASNARSSSRAPRKDPVMDLPACIAGCLDSKMSFDGTGQDFDNTNTIQCRLNHIAMKIKEKELANVDHCLHAMYKGRERCNSRDSGTRRHNVHWRLGKNVFYNPSFRVPFSTQLMRYGLGALYEGGMRQRMFVQVPYIEIPNPEGKNCTETEKRFRSADGSCNNLEMPKMGAVATQFVQTLKPSEPHPNGLPNAVAVAEILKRPEAITPDRLAPFNQLTVLWIQFMTHDWFQHNKTNDGMNRVTHWWDGSQLYGSTAAQAAEVRTIEGKLHLDANDELDYVSGEPLTGFRDNFWAGLHVMHTIWIREHNYIVDKLEEEYSGQYSVEEKFQLARLCVSALIAKIHTIEWTTTLLDNPVTNIGLNANWYGGETSILRYGTRFELNLAYALIGRYYTPYASGKDTTKESLFNTTFQITEEFVSVYRMHSLLPDQVQVGPQTFTLNDLTFTDARQLINTNTTKAFLQAFAETPARTLSLQNYPRELYNLTIPGLPGSISLAEIEIMRDRERNITRYNDMRRQLLLEPLESIDDLTDNEEERALLKSVYTDIEQVELLVGMLVDKDRPSGFAFGIVPFHIFLVFASRRILSDRFLMEDFNPTIYTEWGYNYVQGQDFRSVLTRHFPELAQFMPENPFINW